ncbi:hypothetical protein GCM10029964_008490 [Kibdelosporangium lantanae]
MGQPAQGPFDGVRQHLLGLRDTRDVHERGGQVHGISGEVQFHGHAPNLVHAYPAEMTQDLTIGLDAETFQAAAAMAAKQGISVEDLLAELITGMLAADRLTHGSSGR